jgi:hypothetical protein
MSTQDRLDRAVMRLDEIAADVRYLADQHPALDWLRRLAERIQDMGDEIDDVSCAILIEDIEDDEINAEAKAFVQSRRACTISTSEPEIA